MRPDLAVELLLAFFPFAIIGALIYAASIRGMNDDASR
jgi:hypothetical protein